MAYKLDPNELNIEWSYKSGNGVLAICENPNHDDNHPSMFVSLLSGEEFYYCFSCGFKGSIDSLLLLTGGSKKWLFDNNITHELDSQEWKQLLKNPLAINDSYLDERGISRKEIERFDVRSNNDQIVIPLNSNLTDETIGVKIRLKNPKGKVKYLTFGKQPDYILSKEYKGSDQTGQRFFVTEGMFGLMKFYRYNLNAITPLSSNRYRGLYQYIKKMTTESHQHFYILFDPDYSGYMSAAKLLFDCRALPNVYAFKKFIDIDLASEKVMNEIATNSLSKVTTTDYFEMIKNIELLYGKEIGKKAYNSFMKYIYNSTKD